MKIFSKALCVAALAVAVAPLAKADSIISFTGDDTYCTVTSAACGTAGTINFQDTKTGHGYGIFAPFSQSSNLSWISSFNYLSQSTPFDLFTVASNAADALLTYTVTSLTSSVSGENLSISGSGFYTIYDSLTNSTSEVATGNFSLTTQFGQENNTELVTFSDTNSVTPEPSSLMLLGTGLVSAAGMLMRRRRVIA